MGLLNKLFKKNRNDICTDKNNPYYAYPNELKNFCEYRDKYQDTWNLYGKYTELINHYYYEFINTHNQNDFNKLLIYCQEYSNLLPKIAEAKKEDAKINGTVYKEDTYSLVHHRLSMAYEKAQCYNSAINVCKEAIELGYTDGTKGGFKARINRIKKKQDEINKSIIGRKNL